MGCGTVEERQLQLAARRFQYPLRAYGVWNRGVQPRAVSAPYFQYPLRAYGVWNAPVA